MSDFYVLTQREKIEDALVAAVGLQDKLPPNLRCRNVSALAARMQREPAPIVFVDIDPSPMTAIEEIEPLINLFPDSRFVVLCESPDSAVILRAMQAGARHVQPTDRMATELPGVLDRLHFRREALTTKAGLSVAVCQASGGCGGTTIGVNLANELSLLTEDRVLLVDVDHCYGATGSYLGLSGLYGVAEVLNHTNDIDSNLVATTAIKYRQDLHVLMSPASIDFANAVPLPLHRMPQLLDASRLEYSYTVLDAPRLPATNMIDLAGECDIVLLVFQQLVKDIQIVRSMIAALERHGIPAARILPVMNRYCKRGRMVSLQDAQKAVRLPIHLVRNDFANAALGINHGKPLSEIARKSPLRRDVQALAERLIGIFDQKERGNGKP